ncbi:OmpH family outer membrane protein [Leisingera aquaemixtae]|uniref:OmpH family outer membrane protein n=1 Tax=Leisingera aquaemixtae TaxID=1396826 RepID=UPI003983FAB7
MRQLAPGGWAARGFAVALACFGAAPAFAQDTAQPAPGQGRGYQLGLPQSGILTIQPERLFSESAFGQRVEREMEAEGAVLTAENRRIEAELRREELELTERRSGMEPQAFRALADAFDQKVQDTRRRQEQKLREITQMGEEARREFISASLPVLQQILRETGAGAILDHASVFLSADAADITSLAIARVDAVLGDGAAQEDGDR